MKDRDQLAIFESYREDILNKFKQSLGGENRETPSEIKNEEDHNNIREIKPDGDDDLELDDIDLDSEIEDSDDIVDIEPPKKKNVIVKSNEVSINIGPELRDIVRRLPDVIEDVNVFDEIKKAINDVNADLDGEDKITQTPLAIYDTLIDYGVFSEEERDSDDLENRETDVLQGFEDDYEDDDDISGESEFNLNKKTRREREDFRSGMRRDVERSKAEEILRNLGVDLGERGGIPDDY